jgi:isoquinoline 1-oxidoreductase subunit alpha
MPASCLKQHDFCLFFVIAQPIFVFRFIVLPIQLFFTYFIIMAIFNLNINGKKQQVDVDPATPLLWVLREHLDLVGTKYGCGIAACGACTLHIGDIAMRSCVLPVSQVGNQPITTIEGISEKGDHPVQKAWLELDVAQCGYCQTGQIMNAVALLKANPKPSDAEIEAAMDGNICRCGTYLRIKAAIKTAANSK